MSSHHSTTNSTAPDDSVTDESAGGGGTTSFASAPQDPSDISSTADFHSIMNAALEEDVLEEDEDERSFASDVGVAGGDAAGSASSPSVAFRPPAFASVTATAAASSGSDGIQHDHFSSSQYEVDSIGSSFWTRNTSENEEAEDQSGRRQDTNDSCWLHCKHIQNLFPRVISVVRMRPAIVGSSASMAADVGSSSMLPTAVGSSSLPPASAGVTSSMLPVAVGSRSATGAADEYPGMDESGALSEVSGLTQEPKHRDREQDEGESKSRVREYVQPSDKDVLLGRGGRSNNNPGNLQLHQEKLKYHDAYIHSKKCTKRLHAQALVDAVHGWGGRFIQRENETGSWYEVNNEVAIKKAGQVLREAKIGPEERLEKRIRYSVGKIPR